MTWTSIKIGEVCDFRAIRNIKLLPYVGMEDVESNSGFFIGSLSPKNVKSTTSFFDRSCVLYGKLRPYLNKVFLPDFEGHCSTEFVTLRPDLKQLTREWLSMWLRSASVVSIMTTSGSGARMPRANLSLLKNLELPFPPLEIQKKIVKKINELFAKIDQAQTLRESSLNEVNNLIAATLEQFLQTNVNLKEFSISELASGIQSGFACGKQNEVSEGVVHLRTHNIDLNGELNLEKIVKIPSSLVNKSAFGLKKDDLLFNNTNSTELVGKTIIVREDLQYAFSNHINRIRFNSALVMPEWVLYIFQKYWRDKYFESICTRWVGQSGINQGKLVTIKIPVPPIVEQEKIVVRLNGLKQKIRKIQELQAETVTDLNALKQSILHKAFRGELN